MSRTATLLFVVLTGFAFWSYISDVSSTIKSYDPNSPLFSGGVVVHANGTVVGGLKEEGHRRVGENLEIPFLMSSRTLRRRLHHKDVDGGRYDRYDTSQFDSLNEPLLGNSDYDYNKHSEGQALADILDDERSKERLHWTLLFSNVIAQWAQWLDFRCKQEYIRLKGSISFRFDLTVQRVSDFCLEVEIQQQANIVLGSGSLFGRILPFIPGAQNGANSNLRPVLLSPLQEARLKYLKQRLSVPFDGSFSEHQDALRQLWRLSYPDRQLPALKSEVWKEMGWQGSDPSTDFRSEWEYPFAVAGINISFMLVQMLDLQSGNPNTLAGHRFLELLSQDEMAFDNLFCDVLKSTRSQLEREMALEDVSSVRDLPAFNLLKS
ncbi:hypothetical protein DH2020_039134 [Rehmannia glutinosa]|uniref:ELMO domain-containing protein n=1 Tax=Rehmannia glutinosa TaxID=99300 RepID=A0ABR0UXC3_REHGL